MQRLTNRDTICALIVVLFSIGAWMQALALPARSAMFPRLVIGLLLVFSVLYLLRSLWRASGAEFTAPFFANLARFLIALLLIAGYVLVFPRVGFFTATFVFIPVFSVAIGLRKITNALITSALFTFGAWGIFVVLLGRRLPPENLLMFLTGSAP